MKYACYIGLALLAFVAFSCGNSTASAGSSAAAATTGSGTVAAGALADASFSCTLNGTPISGKGVDGLQLRNTANLYPDQGKGEQVLFFLSSSKNGEDPKPDYAFRIKLPSRPGTYTRKASDEFDAKTMPSFTLDLMTGDLSRYWVGRTATNDDVATVTITSNDGKRLKGTFSASLSLSNDTPRGNVKKMVVTDGTFDIPFNTGNLRPE